MPAVLHLVDLACQLSCPYQSLHVRTGELSIYSNANRLFCKTQDSRHVANELVSYSWTIKFQSWKVAAEATGCNCAK